MYQSFFEADEQAKKMQLIYINRIMKIMSFKKWAKVTQENPIVRQEEVKQESKESKQKLIVNLKFGDVIYLKYYADSTQKGIISGDGIASNKLECLIQRFSDDHTQPQDNQQSFLNKSVQEDPNNKQQQKAEYLTAVANMIKQNESTGSSIFKKSAEQQFRKCLFKVINEKRYFYQEKQQEKKKQTQKNQNSKDANYLDPKVQEEQNENKANYLRLKGTNICYGQVIQLQHLYSDCTMTLNQNVLATQNCCREMSLEEKDNQWSNFIIISPSGTKKVGEPVLYGDPIHLQSQMDKNFWLNIENLQEGQLFTPLEVNASEFNSSIKLCNYLDHKTFEERELPQVKGKNLQPGEVVRIFNRSQNGFIGVKKKGQFTKILQKRTVEFQEEGKSNILKMEQDYFDRVKSIKKIQLNYQLFVQKKEENQDQNPIVQIQKNKNSKKQDNQAFDADIFSERSGNVDIQTLWEIQKKDSFSSDFPTHDGLYCLKNLASGLYLSIQSSPFQNVYKGYQGMDFWYILTFENTCPYNLFRLAQSKQSKNAQKDIPIQYVNNITIQSFPDLKLTDNKMTERVLENMRSLVLTDYKVKDKKNIQVECVSKLDKQSKDKYIYELVSVSKDLRQQLN